MKKYLIICLPLMILLITSKFRAQTLSIVRIADLAIYPKINPGEYVDTVNTFFLSGKIDSIQLASKVYFKLGSANDVGDALTVVCNVGYVSGQYYLSYNGTDYPFKNYTVFLPIIVPKPNIPNLLNITFYVEDILGKNTIKKYLRLN